MHSKENRGFCMSLEAIMFILKKTKYQVCMHYAITYATSNIILFEKRNYILWP